MPIRHKIDRRVREVIGALRRHGFDAFIVGGAVRDLLLGIDPKDYDIATSARPEEVKRVFGHRARIIGRRFRLVHLYIDGAVYEVSTFRREPTPEERRGRVTDDGVMIWRDNAYGSHEEDAVRRDFTVNAIYYDPVGDRGIIDFVGGIEDLNTRVVRAIGEPRLRLAEDPVRILRALKLAARYGFGIRPDLKEAIAEMAPSISLSSKARLFEEILKILLHAHTLSTFVLCRDHGLLNHLWPSLDAVWYTPVGDLTRRLMAERDRRVKAGGYSRSKTLALATICFAAVAEDLGSPAPGCLWEYRHGIESGCRDAVSRFFLPFRIPRFLSARVRDVLLLQPRFQARYSRRVTRHPEYKYARELFSALTSVMGWDASQLGAWPVPHGGHRGAAAEPPGEEDLTEPGGAVTEQ